MSRSKIAILIATIVVVAGAIVIVSLKLGGMGSSRDERSEGERVRLEIRANRAATIVMNGKTIGHTPISIYVPKTSVQTTLEATMIEHWAKRGGQMTEPERHMTKTIVPDHDQVVDFVAPATHPE